MTVKTLSLKCSRLNIQNEGGLWSSSYTTLILTDLFVQALIHQELNPTISSTLVLVTLLRRRKHKIFRVNYGAPAMPPLQALMH